MGKVKTSFALAAALAALTGLTRSSMPDIAPLKPYTPPRECLINGESAQSPKLAYRMCREALFPDSKQDKYAVIINASEEERFVHETSLVYQILIENGYKRENTYILNTTEKESYLYPVDGTATKRNIKAVFDHLSRTLDKEDRIVVHVSDHGDRVMSSDGNYTEVVLPEGNMTEQEFQSYLSALKTKTGIVTAEICYGGGLVKRAAVEGFIGISAADETTKSYQNTNDTFSGFFYHAFRNSEESDTNKDRVVTVDEAFEYAKSKNSSAKSGVNHPQLFSFAGKDPSKESIR